MKRTADPTEALHKGQRIAKDMCDCADFLEELEYLRATLAGEDIMETGLDRLQNAANMPSFDELTLKILGFLGFDFTETAPEGTAPLYHGEVSDNIFYRRAKGGMQKAIVDYELGYLTIRGPGEEVETLQIADLIQKGLDKPIRLYDF